MSLIVTNKKLHFRSLLSPPNNIVWDTKCINLKS